MSNKDTDAEMSGDELPESQGDLLQPEVVEAMEVTRPLNVFHAFSSDGVPEAWERVHQFPDGALCSTADLIERALEGTVEGEEDDQGWVSVAVDAATDEFRVLEALGAEPVAPAQGSMTMSFNVDTETARCVAMALQARDMYRARDTMFDELRVETHTVLVTHLKSAIETSLLSAEHKAKVESWLSWATSNPKEGEDKYAKVEFNLEMLMHSYQSPVVVCV